MFAAGLLFRSHTHKFSLLRVNLSLLYDKLVIINNSRGISSANTEMLFLRPIWPNNSLCCYNLHCDFIRSLSNPVLFYIKLLLWQWQAIHISGLVRQATWSSTWKSIWRSTWNGIITAEIILVLLTVSANNRTKIEWICKMGRGRNSYSM